MSLGALIGFCVLSGFAAWVQTITGFAIAVIIAAGVAVTGLMPLPDAAALISALSFVNGAHLALADRRHIALRPFALVLATSLPMVVAGFFLLDWLSASRADALKLLLAGVIVLSSLQLAVPPRAEPRMPGAAAFLGAGVAAGLMGGLFAASGPPLAWRFWRTPLPAVSIRATLVAVFTLNALLRLALVATTDFRPAPGTWLGLLAAPVVTAATAAARRWPPPLAPTTLRRLVFVLLAAAGVSIGWPAAMRLIG
jgi:hypothetical protein